MSIRTIQVIKRGRQGIAGTLGMLTTANKSTNFQAVEGEKAYCYVCTGVLTVTFQSAAALGNGWMCYIEATGGDVTLDPTETINGQASIVIPNGAMALVFTDGLTFRSYILADDPGFDWNGPWAASTAYVVRDTVQFAGASYICVANHTSDSDFGTDLGAGRWELLADRGADGGVGWTATEYSGSLDSLTTTGWRMLGGGATGFPAGIAGGSNPQYDMVLTLYAGPNQITQQYIEKATGQVWTRTRTEIGPGLFTWSSWRGLGVREYPNTWTAANTFAGTVDLTAATVLGVFAGSAALDTTSGTSINFTGIPDWATEINLFVNAVSFTAIASLGVRIGDAGGLDTAGYFGVSTDYVSTLNPTDRWGIATIPGDANTITGTVTLRKSANGNLWFLEGQVNVATTVWTFSGRKGLDTALDRLSLIGGTFDNGTAELTWRR